VRRNYNSSNNGWSGLKRNSDRKFGEQGWRKNSERDFGDQGVENERMLLGNSTGLWTPP